MTVRLKPHDRNRLHIRATRCRTKVRRARGRSGGQRYRSTKRPQRKNFPGTIPTNRKEHTKTAISIKETPSTTTSELTTAFDEWLDGLDTPQVTLTKHSMEILAKSMRKSMALRDAILLSVICAGNPEYDKGKLRDYAAAPHIPNHQLSEWCERMMKWSFAHAGHETDKDKVLNASRMLVDIVYTVEDTDLKLQAQPLAIISYILWWMGDERAMLAVMRALAVDEECSLTAIVAAAIHGDQWPNRN